MRLQRHNLRIEQSAHIGGTESLHLCGAKREDLIRTQCLYLVRIECTQIVRREHIHARSTQRWDMGSGQRTQIRIA